MVIFIAAYLVVNIGGFLFPHPDSSYGGQRFSRLSLHPVGRNTSDVLRDSNADYEPYNVQ